MKQYSLTIILLLSVLSVAGQSSADIDRKTYALYQNQEWKELVGYYHENVNPGKVDFYYLRMRIGIAYYELENYLSAIAYFEKALEFNSTAVAKEYLYYSYFFTGQHRKANGVYDRMSAEARNKVTHPERKLFKNITAEYGRNISDAYDQNAGTDFSGEAGIYGEASFTGNTDYWYFGMQHQLSDGLTLNHGISGFNISNTMNFDIPEREMEVPYDISQNDYYLDLSYHLPNSSSLSLVMHVLWVDYDLPYMSFDGQQYQLAFSSVELSDYLLYGQWEKLTGHVKTTVGASFSSVNGAEQQQADLSIAAFPMGNMKLIPSLKASYYRQQKSISTNKQQEWLITPSLSAAISQRFRMTAGITFGDIYQYHENKAFIVYNNTDKITRKISANARYQLSDHLTVNLSYRYLEREAKGLTYTGTVTTEEKIFIFTTHYIIGGIVWKL